MKRLVTLLVAGCLTLALGFPAAMASSSANGHHKSAPLPNMPYTRFRLPNGLTVVVSEDHKAPVVAVAVWYHVGSAREPMGKSGYAHMFEHLMFEGSEHHQGDFMAPFEKVGAIGMNGTTARDRTNYFETVPTSALDMALWMESDRMGWLLQGLTKGAVNQQRGVVQNEKRKDEDQPLGLVEEENIEAHAYPLNHPYHHDTIGSMKDLNAASIKDFKHWFKTYYGPNNATLVLVGDITPKEARAKAMKYFGNIKPGSAVAEMQPWAFPRDKSTHGKMHRNVSQVHLLREWNTPHEGSHDDELLNLAAWVLGHGKTSRLYQRLVYQDKLADSVSVSEDSDELASQFSLSVEIKNGVDPEKVKAAVADVWKKFLKEGPTHDELVRARTTVRARYIRRMESVGGFGGKATMLAAGQVYHNDPSAWRKSLKMMMTATPDDVRDAARKWLSKGDYTLTVLPLSKGQKPTTADEATAGGLGPAKGMPKSTMASASGKKLHAVKSDVDRGKGVPEVKHFPELTFPKLQRATLKNGIKVTLARRTAVPLVSMSLQFDSGYSSDKGHKLGRASFAMSMLQEGTTDLNSTQIAKREQRFGAHIDTDCGLDTCIAMLSSLTDKLKPSLELLADVVQHPAFRDADMHRLRGQWLAGIAKAKNQPMGMATRVLPPLLYGKGYPYAMPLRGSGTVDSVKALTRSDLQDFMHSFIRPDNVRILVAGDISMKKLVSELNQVFDDWKTPKTSVPKQNLSKVTPPDHDRVFLLDRPGSLQSTIIAGVVAPSGKASNHLAIDTMNATFGGTFTSRLNMDLRESKHWAYGAHSMVLGPVGPGMFLMLAPVQTDKTAPSIKAMVKQAKAIAGPKPPTTEEIAKVKAQRIHSLPGQYQTNGAALQALQRIALYDRPDDYVARLKSRIEDISNDAVEKAAKEVVQPGHLTWVIVGDLDKIGKSVRDLDLGPVQVLDKDGKPVDED